MPSSHPNFLDKIALKIYPRYLYPSQICLTLATVNIGMIHKLPDVKPYWKIMDYLYLKKDSTLKFLGLARNLGFEGEIKPFDSIFELVRPEVDENKSAGKHVGSGDLVCVTSSDRRFIAACPTEALQGEGGPLYYTAADQ